VILKQQGTSAYITKMYFQLTVNKTGKYKCYGHCSIQVLLSPLEIIVHHIVYSSPFDFSAT